MADPKTVGTGTGVATGLALQPGIDWTIEDKARCTLTYAGPYTDALAAVLGEEPTYKRGQTETISGVTGMALEKIGVKRTPGDRGLLTLTYSKALADTAQGSEGYSEEEPKPECEWVETSRALESHPRYTHAKDLAGNDIQGLNPISESGFAFIAEYFKADAERQKDMYDPDAPENQQGEIEEFGSAGLMKELIGKKLRGQNEFVLYSPVFRLVSVINGIPNSSNCGLRVATPAEAPSDYVYLQTADRTLPGATAGRYTRTIELTGADSVDEDIYPAAAEPPEE